MESDSPVVVEPDDDDEKCLEVVLTDRQPVGLTVVSASAVKAKFAETKAMMTECAYDITSVKGKRSMRFMKKAEPCVELIRRGAEEITKREDTTLAEKALATAAFEVALNSTSALGKVGAATTDPHLADGTAALLGAAMTDLRSNIRVTGRMYLQGLHKVKQPLLRKIESGQEIEDPTVMAALAKCIKKEETANQVLSDSLSNDEDVNIVLIDDFVAHSELVEAVAVSDSIDEATKKEVVSAWAKMFDTANIAISLATYASVTYGWYITGSIVATGTVAMAAGPAAGAAVIFTAVEAMTGTQVIAVGLGIVVPPVYFAFSGARAIWNTFFGKKTDTKTETETDDKKDPETKS